jgi:monoamine oxidase
MHTVRQAHWLNENPQHRTLFLEARDASGVSRRDFVRMLSAAGIWTAAGGIIPRSARAEADFLSGPGTADPVAIIGAGVAGLTAAYRLLQAGIPCEIFEASERIGGRMFSKYDFNKDGMFCELGGELVDTNHTDLIALAKELGVGIQDFQDGDNGVDLYFFGGKYYSDEQVIPLFEPFAKKLAEDKKGIYDADDAYTPKAAKFDRISLAAYLDETGKGVEKWVIDLLRVAYLIEYGRELGEQSSLNLITLLEPDISHGFELFGNSDESKRIQGGSSALTNALAQRLEGKVHIHQGHRLARIGQTSHNITLDFSADNKTKSLKFSRVICTIPFTMLRLVEGVKALPLGKAKQKAIAQLGYGDHVKIMSGFSERWWRNPAVKLPKPSDGTVFTDLPLQCIWETSRGQTGQSGILTAFLAGNNAKLFTSERLAKLPEELNQVFPGIGDKSDGKRAIMDWTKYQFTQGSYSCPLVDQHTTLLEAVSKSELTGRLIFAGEHTSDDFIGFMNGGVESGNRAAKEIIGSKKIELRKAA